MIDFIKTVVHDYAPLVSFILTTIASTAVYWFRKEVNLIWGSKSDFRHILSPKEVEVDGKKTKQPQQQTIIHSAHYFIRNNGRAIAKEVEIVLNFVPDQISVWPQRQYGLSTNNEGRQIIYLPFVGARESIDVMLLTVGRDLPSVLNVKCPESFGRFVQIDFHRVLSKKIYYGAWALIFLGAVFVIETLIKLIASYWP